MLTRHAAQQAVQNRSRLYGSLPLRENEIRVFRLQPTESTSTDQTICGSLSVTKLPEKNAKCLAGYATAWKFDKLLVGGGWRSPDGQNFTRGGLVAGSDKYLYTEDNRYEALSYVWGDADMSKIIYINGLPIRINNNLHQALRYMVSKEAERILWIDAICINQHNDSEKTLQVAMMSSIYSAAWRTVIWLGEETELREGLLCLHFWHWLRTRIELELFSSYPLDWVLSQARGTPGLPDDPTSLRYISPNHDTEHILASGDVFHLTGRDLPTELDESNVIPNSFGREKIDIDHSVLTHFFYRPWFSRRWILQEFGLSQFKVLQVGSYYIPWTMHNTPNVHRLRMDRKDSISKSDLAIMKGLRILCMDTDFGPDAVEELWSELRQFDENDCSDDRDRLAAFQWRINQAMIYGCLYRTEYEWPVEQNYMAFASAVITYAAKETAFGVTSNRRGSWKSIREELLRGLIMSSACRQQARETRLLPSWVPDWRVRIDQQPRYFARYSKREEQVEIEALKPHLRIKRISFMAWLPRSDSPRLLGDNLQIEIRPLATLSILTSWAHFRDGDTVVLVLRDDNHQRGYEALGLDESFILRPVAVVTKLFRVVGANVQFYFTDEGLKSHFDVEPSPQGPNICLLWSHLAKHGGLEYIENERREYRKLGVEIKKLACYRSHEECMTITLV